MAAKERPMTTDSPSYHYALIARALREMDAAGPGLTLEGLATRIGLSPAHFQRVFSQWVGVSPKRYQQYLALDHARDLLARRFSVLQTAHESGLSGAGRLHDLFVTWEAMSPGDYAKGGAGITIRWGFAPSPFGDTVIMATDRGICGMGFAAEMGPELATDDLMRRWPAASFHRDDAAIAPLAEAAFGGGRTPLHLIGAFASPLGPCHQLFADRRGHRP
jgi:AraC family transcriptional regulator of adaptative response/methylated-DNA-[protein]-cysteine methyltransferase